MRSIQLLESIEVDFHPWSNFTSWYCAIFPFHISFALVLSNLFSVVIIRYTFTFMHIGALPFIQKPQITLHQMLPQSCKQFDFKQSDFVYTRSDKFSGKVVANQWNMLIITVILTDRLNYLYHCCINHTKKQIVFTIYCPELQPQTTHNQRNLQYTIVVLYGNANDSCT